MSAPIPSWSSHHTIISAWLPLFALETLGVLLQWKKIECISMSSKTFWNHGMSDICKNPVLCHTGHTDIMQKQKSWIVFIFYHTLHIFWYCAGWACMSICRRVQFVLPILVSVPENCDCNQTEELSVKGRTVFIVIPYLWMNQKSVVIMLKVLTDSNTLMFLIIFGQWIDLFLNISKARFFRDQWRQLNIDPVWYYAPSRIP